MKTAEKIKKIREEKNFSQYKLAKLSKRLNQSQISKIEKGARKITDTDLQCIATGLGVEVAELISDREVISID